MNAQKQLLSGWEMLKVKAAAFTEVMVSLGVVKGMEFSTKAVGLLPSISDEPADQNFADGVKKPVEALIPALAVLDLPVTLAAAQRLKEKLLVGGIRNQELFQLSESIHLRIKDELGSRYFLSLSKSEAAEYDSDGFGDDVHAKFPSIAFELDEASKCMALGRYTAAVFHWMRAVEAALRAVRLCLGATTPLVAQGRNWGSILNELRDMRAGKSPRWPENDYFSGVILSIEAVMHAWRNSTMHIENKYTREEAESIRDCVKALLQRIASRMDEQGLPRA